MNDFILAYKKYAQFEGRSDRKEFWYFVMVYIIIVAILGVLDGVLFGTGQAGMESGGLHSSASSPLAAIFMIGSFIPYLAVSVRRLHDTGKTGWWILIGLIPLIGIIWLIVLYAEKGQPEANAHGEPPAGSLPV